MAIDDGAAIDEGDLDRQTGGDAALAREVLRLFLEAVVPEGRRIAGEAEPSRRRLAHKLKGAAGGIGARRLAAASARLIEAPLEADALRDFTAELDAAEAAIRRRLGEA